MKAILEFNLPEDGTDFDMAHKGHMYYVALCEISEYFRSKLKYGDLITEEEYKIIEKTRSDILEIIGSLLEEY